MSKTDLGKREDLVGIKINVTTLIEINKTIKDIKTLFDKYIDGDVYSIGLDETFCSQSHYHLHFRTKCKYNTITDFKSKNFKNQPTTKLYCAKKYTESQDEVWFAYPIKEQIIEIGTGLKKEDLEHLAKIQREIKKSKHNFHEKESHKKEQKKNDTEKMFEWITANKYRIACEYKCLDFLNPEIIGLPFKAICLAQYCYYKEFNDCHIPPKFMLERNARNYLVKYDHWSIENIYNHDFRN